MVRHENPVEPMNTPATSAQETDALESVLFSATGTVLDEGSKVVRLGKGLGVELGSTGNKIDSS